MITKHLRFSTQFSTPATMRLAIICLVLVIHIQSVFAQSDPSPEGIVALQEPVLTESTAQVSTTEFVDNYDMDGDYAKHVYRVDGVRVWNQHENGYDVRGWGPRETGKEGTLVLRYVFDKPIQSCSIRAYLNKWFDETDSVSLAVSSDDENYVVLTTSSLVPERAKPFRQRVLDLTPHVQGASQVFIRIRLRGAKLNTHITTPEFLRTDPLTENLKDPHNYEFRATLRD